MTYATLDILTDRYGEQMLIDLTDRTDPPVDAIVLDVVGQAQADTDAVIDGFLAGRYVLPLDETPPLLTDLAAAIAIYKLHRYAPDPKIEQDYKDALASLSLISKGTIRLPVEGVEPESSGASGVQTTDRDRPFTQENMKGYI